MRAALFAALAFAVASAPASVLAKPKPKAKAKPVIKDGTAAKKGFYKILVKPNAKWTLHNTMPDFAEAKPGGGAKQPLDTITIETYDVRKVGNADVARLRWVHHTDERDDDSFLGQTRIEINITQVAVTDAGLYLLTKDMNDAKIAEALKGKPSRSDPPKAYKGTKLNTGRYLEVTKGGEVCLGWLPLPDAPECEDVCGGSMCISATDGIVSLDGDWAPDFNDYGK